VIPEGVAGIIMKGAALDDHEVTAPHAVPPVRIDGRAVSVPVESFEDTGRGAQAANRRPAMPLDLSGAAGRGKGAEGGSGVSGAGAAQGQIQPRCCARCTAACRFSTPSFVVTDDR
jgi:hypothetical protein